MLHLIKLAVGIRDLAHLAKVQSARRAPQSPLVFHITRMRPQRCGEILDGGSIYWVIAGQVRARQLVRDIAADQGSDGITRAALGLEPTLVPVANRLMRPFQGWRYLLPADAPIDLAQQPATDGTPIPAILAEELRRLALL